MVRDEEAELVVYLGDLRSGDNLGEKGSAHPFRALMSSSCFSFVLKGFLYCSMNTGRGDVKHWLAASVGAAP